MDIISAVQMRIVDQPFPPYGSARLLKIYAHDDFHVVCQFLAENAKAKLGTLKGEQKQQADKSQKTDFSEMTGTFTIRNGVAHNSDLSVKSPLLRVGGEGDINIGEDSLNYLVKASVVGTTKGQGGMRSFRRPSATASF